MSSHNNATYKPGRKMPMTCTFDGIKLYLYHGQRTIRGTCPSLEKTKVDKDAFVRRNYHGEICTGGSRTLFFI